MLREPPFFRLRPLPDPECRDHFEQQATALLNIAGVALLFIGKSIKPLKDFAEPEDTIERRTQFVAHTGEEITF